MKKFAKTILVFLMVFALALGTIACSGNKEEVGGSKNCQIKLELNGWGDGWLKEMITNFNQMYAEEGYTAELVREDSSINARNEINTPSRNQTDLYFERDNINLLIENSRSILGKEGGYLLEDLNDVLDSKPIGSDKTEESMTIRDKILKNSNQTLIDSYKYTGQISSYKSDAVYSLPYSSISVKGIYLNKKALTDLGYTMDDLLTTDALLDMCEKIVEGRNPSDEGYNDMFFPVAFAGGNAPGYYSYIADYWFAQYMCEDDYNYEDWYAFQPKEGTIEQDGYKVYEDPAILEGLRVVEDLANSDFNVPGSTSALHTTAQARVFLGTTNEKGAGGSLLMVTGDWIFSEMQKDYGTYLNDVIAIKAPIISALGEKLGLCGATHAVNYTTDNDRQDRCATCESKLRQIVKLVDEYDYTQKSNAQIASEVGVEESDVRTIRTARGYVIGATGGNLISIPSYADAKDVAKLFVRYFYSEEGQAIYTKHTYTTAWTTNQPEMSTMNEREKSAYLQKNDYNSSILMADETIPLRKEIGAFFIASGTIAQTYGSLSYSHANTANPNTTAESIYNANKQYIKASWDGYVQAISRS